MSLEINSSEPNRNFMTILKGSAISIGLTLIALLVFSYILTYTNVSEDTTFPVIVIITAVSILIGSSLCNIKLRKNGFLNGGAVGAIYIAFIYLLSSIFTMDFSIGMDSLVIIITGVLAGMLGGIIGVNIRK
ncbi:MAG: TIGR04086 family membrane protein [Oscillospiraceae bacterium]|nr:TIGR04086 family membrane protein [Oscillospiraceae bacterium]